MDTHTYAVSEFVTVESEFPVFLFDTPPLGPVAEPDVVLRETGDGAVTAEAADGQLRIGVPSALPTEKETSAVPVEFTKVLKSAIERRLLRQGAALLFGAALETPDGEGVGLFCDSGRGKSTTAFRLSGRRGYRLLGDDLLIAHGGAVYPFPRYAALPRDVPAVEEWVRSLDPEVRAASTRPWDDEVDVPRALLSDTVPGRTDLDYAVFVDPDRRPRNGTERIPTGTALSLLEGWNRANLAGWTSHPAVRTSGHPGADRRGIVRGPIEGADCYLSGSPAEALPRTVADLVGSALPVGPP